VKNKAMLSLVLLCIGATLAQDTHYCPDGWHKHEYHDHGPEVHVECILLSREHERVTKEDAAIICDYHGGWLVDMDEGWAQEKNDLLKYLIDLQSGQGGIGLPGPQYGDQWWLGSTVHGRHDEHNWGNWTWDHSGSELTWYDWMDGEPNNWEHHQQCLTMLKLQDIFGYGVWHWNDWACNEMAQYICEKPAEVRARRLF
jgi:hypothetical protein